MIVVAKVGLDACLLASTVINADENLGIEVGVVGNAQYAGISRDELEDTCDIDLHPVR